MRLLKGLLNWIVAGWSILLAGSYLGFLGARWIPHGFIESIAYLAFVLACCACFLSALLPFWNRALAGRFGLWAALPIAILMVGYATLHSATEHWKRLLAVAVIALLFCLPALFWKATAARGWPQLTHARWQNLITASICIGTLLFSCVVTVLFAVHTPRVGDCDHSARPYAQQASPEHVVAVARVLHTSVIFGTVAVVEHHYWGLPWWNRKLVFFRWLPFWSAKTLFIDGRRQDGLLSRFLPVLYFNCATRTKRLENADVDLRVLRDGPQPGFRIIGSVGTYRSYADPDVDPAPGVVIEAKSGDLKFTTTTDAHGIFDFKNLPLAKYRVTAPAAKGWDCDPYPYAWKEPQSGEVGECVLHAATRQR